MTDLVCAPRKHSVVIAANWPSPRFSFGQYVSWEFDLAEIGRPGIIQYNRGQVFGMAYYGQLKGWMYEVEIDLDRSDTINEDELVEEILLQPWLKEVAR